MREVSLLVREGRGQVVGLSDQDHPAGLREVQPLVGVHGARVGPFQPGEQGPGRGRGRGRKAVRAVEVEPHAPLLAHIGQRIRGIDRAGERRPSRRHHRHGRHALVPVPIDGLGDRVGPELALVVDGQRPDVAGPDPQELDGARDRVVHLREQYTAPRRPASSRRRSCLSDPASTRRPMTRTQARARPRRRQPGKRARCLPG